MDPGVEPGLGVDSGEEKVGKFPDEQAYLPINRKEDGTLFHRQHHSLAYRNRLTSSKIN